MDGDGRAADEHHHEPRAGRRTGVLPEEPRAAAHTLGDGPRLPPRGRMAGIGPRLMGRARPHDRPGTAHQRIGLLPPHGNRLAARRGGPVDGLRQPPRQCRDAHAGKRAAGTEQELVSACPAARRAGVVLHRRLHADIERQCRAQAGGVCAAEHRRVRQAAGKEDARPEDAHADAAPVVRQGVQDELQPAAAHRLVCRHQQQPTAADRP